MLQRDFLGVVNTGKHRTLFARLFFTFRQFQPNFDQEVSHWQLGLNSGFQCPFSVSLFQHIPHVSVILTPQRPVYPVKCSAISLKRVPGLRSSKHTKRREWSDLEIRASRPTGRTASLFWSAPPLSRPGCTEGLFFRLVLRKVTLQKSTTKVPSQFCNYSAFPANRCASLCGRLREHSVGAIKEVQHSQSWDV